MRLKRKLNTHLMISILVFFLPFRARAGEIPIPEPTAASFYGTFAMSEYKPDAWKVPLTAVFLDYDGTIEIGDKLSIEIFKSMGATDPDNGKDMQAWTFEQIKEVFDQRVANKQISGSFKSEERNLKGNIEALRKNGVKVYMLSATWPPVSGPDWQKFVHYVVTEHLGLGFALEDVIGVGPDQRWRVMRGDPPKLVNVMADKGGLLSQKMSGQTLGAVHVDNSFKYISSIISSGANFIWVKSDEGITKAHFEMLISQSLLQKKSGKKKAQVQVASADPRLQMVLPTFRMSGFVNVVIFFINSIFWYYYGKRQQNKSVALIDFADPLFGDM